MNDKPSLAPYFLIALALVGLGDAFYLSYYQYLNLIPTCAVGGCETVLTSVYSKFMGVHLAYIGLVYYAYSLGLSILLAIEPRSFALRLGALLYALIGFLYSIYYIFYIQLSLIGALCLYCALSGVVTFLLFLTALLHFRSARQNGN